MNDDLLQDSIRKVQKAHRRPDISQQIKARVDEIRSLAPAPAAPVPQDVIRVKRPYVRKKANAEDALPLSPSKASRLGLTSILPPMRVAKEEAFKDFLLSLSDPDFRSQHPTWRSIADRFGVSVQTIRTWMLSEEVAKAMKSAIAHEAALALPSVLRAVRLRAELTGDPHAAEWVRKVAKVGTAETEQAASFERTLKEIALERARTPVGLPAARKTIDVTVTEVRAPEGHPDPLDDK
jgi:hypothetical protein